MSVTRREFLTVTVAGVVTLPRTMDALARWGIREGPAPQSIVATINTGPFLSEPTQKDEWSPGWTIGRPFTVAQPEAGVVKRYFFFLKTGTGVMHVSALTADGKIGSLVQADDWTSGWSDAAFVTTSIGTFLILLKTEGLSDSNHRAHVDVMNADGTVGSTVDTADWESGWTNLAPYRTSDGTFLLVYRRGRDLDGIRSRVYRVNDNGTLSGTPLWSYAWDGGWTSVTPYLIEEQTYFLLARAGAPLAGGTRARIHSAKPSGEIETTPLQNYGWGEGWTLAKVFEAAARPYLIRYNADGRAHILAMKADGRVGSRVAWYATPEGNGMGNGSLGYRNGPIAWNSGWTTIEAFPAEDGNIYLFTLQSGTGRMHMSRVQPMADVGPAVTHVDDHAASIWIGLVGGRLDRRPTYTVEYKEQSGGGGWQTAGVDLRYAAHPPGETGPIQDYYVAGVAGLSALEPSQRYDYRVLAGREQISSGEFATSPSPGSRTSFRALVASCMDLQDSRSQPAWNHATTLKPDVVLLLGDTAYVNSTDRSMHWAEHLQQRAIPSFARLIASVPTFAQWDDHDFGPNNETGLSVGSARRDESRDAFRELFPNPLRRNATGGNYFRLRWGSVDFFVLDGRFYAHEHDSNDGSKLLGNTQWDWLEQELEASTATFKVITSGITLSEDVTESWRQGYPGELKKLLKLIKEHDGVFVVTGDVHYCTIRRHDRISGVDVRLRYPLYEVISSGVTSCHHSFATLDFDFASDPARVTASVYRQDGTLRGSETFTASALG